MTSITTPFHGRPGSPISRLVRLLNERHQLARLNALRERLPLNDPDRHALDTETDRRFDELAAAYTPLTNEERQDALWQAIQKDGGRWKSGRARRLYRSLGYGHISKSTASHDLKALRAAGHLVQHDVEGVRYFTLAGGSDV